jgi:ArsR family transcriptional regulator
MKSSKTPCCNVPKPGSRNNVSIKPDVGLEAIEGLGGIEVLSRKIPDNEELVKKSRRYHALSDPLRLTILYLLKDQPLCVCVINRFMHLADSKLSYHLAVLKEGGLIEGEYRGNWIYYSLTDTGREYIF